MYVARFSNNIEQDIQRGWSGYMGHTWKTLREWCEDIGLIDFDFEEYMGESFEDIQSRWVFSYGDMYEDVDIFINDLVEELANKHDMRYDEDIEMWRAVHHDGLSCWPLAAEKENDAINEAKKLEKQWAGNGYATIGGVVVIAKIDHKNGALYVLKCDDSQVEI